MARPRSVDRSIEIKFLADLAQLKAGSKAAEQSLGGLSGKAFQVGNVVNLIGLAAQAGDALIGTWFKLAQAASDYDQALGKLNAVFGDASGALTSFAESSATAWGQSRTEVINFAGDIGNVFTSMGVAREEAAKMSATTLRLASDMAAFANLPISEALVAIRSGLVGETEPLRRFGILLNDAGVKAEALATGIWDGSGAMTDAEKVISRFNLMQRRGANMAGSFAREVDTLQVQSQKLGAEFADLTLQLGEGGLEDAAIQAIKALRGVVLSIQDLAGGAEETRKVFGSKEFAGFLEGIADWWTGALVLEKVGGAFAGVADKADAAAMTIDLSAGAQAAANAVAATAAAYERGVTDAITAKTAALKNQKAAIDAAYKATETYLAGMAEMGSTLDAAFAALDKPTLRQKLKKMFKAMTTDDFVKASKSGDPERKRQAEYAAMTYGRSLVEAGKKFKSTGNPVVDNWIKKGMEDSNWHKSLDTLLTRLQTYLNQNPLTVNISEIMRITGKRSKAQGGGAGGVGQQSLGAGAGGIAITVNTGVGDPVAIGREVSRVLGAYSTRVGHI